MKPYRRPVPNMWWLKRTPYLLFMVRELTAVFVGAYCVFMLVFIYRLGQGPEAYQGMLEALTCPSSIILHLIALVFAIYHSITWFNLTPKIMVLQLGEEKVPSLLISGANFAAWLVVSIVLGFIILKVKL